MSKKIEQINDVANACGYFYNAYLEKNITVNNGYNCKHLSQEENETVNGEKIGKCYCHCCPFGYEPDEEDFKNPDIDNQGYEYEEGQFIVVDDTVIKVEKEW